MIQRFAAQLPVWARPEHPFLRYGLKGRRASKRSQYARALMVILVMLGLALGGYLVATNFTRSAPGQHLTESLVNILFWPVLIVQVITRLGVLALTVNTVSEEKRRQTWDSLRATESGAELALRTRWVAVFYRLRGVLGFLMLVRVVLIVGILVDLTAFRGGYLDRLLNGIIPEVPVLVGAVLLAFMMTGSLLLPLTGIGFDAAVGLLVSTTFQQRTYSVLVQIILAAVRLALVALLVIGMTQFTRGALALPDVLAWLLVGAFATMGDWGIALLQLGFYGEIWATVPYGVFIGVGLLAFSLVQAVLTDWILAYAIRRAERVG